MFGRLFAACAALSLFSGCAIHPLPEDVTGVTTIQIVQQIRCEARDALRNDVIIFLRRLGDPYTDALALQYETDPASIRTFSPNLFRGAKWARVREVVQLFYNTGIAYNFDLDMFEDNNVSANANFANAMVNPIFSLNLSGAVNRKRENDRQFTATDTFSGLLKVTEDYCLGRVVHANYIYPLTGRIGVDRLINDFIELTLFGSLAGKADNPKGPPTMADVLTYTTLITGTVNPQITFTPVTSAFRLTTASISATADRSDAHKVTIALALPPDVLVDLDPVRGQLYGRRGNGGWIVGRRVTGGGSASERLAVAVVDQIKSREVKIVPNL
jgi:hypothetical protein